MKQQTERNRSLAKIRSICTLYPITGWIKHRSVFAIDFVVGRKKASVMDVNNSHRLCGSIGDEAVNKK